MSFLDSIKGAVSQFAAKRRDVAAEIEKLRRLREDIQMAPASRDDVKAFLTERHTARLQEFDRVLLGNLQKFIHDPAAMSDPRQVAEFTLWRPTANNMSSLNQRAPELVVAALADSYLSALLTRVDALAWPSNARPLAGREKAIADIDRQLAVLEAERAALIYAARQAGLVVQED